MSVPNSNFEEKPRTYVFGKSCFSIEILKLIVRNHD